VNHPFMLNFVNCRIRYNFKVIPWYTKAKTLLRERHITLEQVGKKLGIGKSNVSQMLNGRTNAKIGYIKGIADMLNMSVAELTSEDHYYVSDETERELIDAVRDLDEKQKREALKMIAILKALDT